MDGVALYAREVEALRADLSMTRADAALTARAGGAHEPLPRGAARSVPSPRTTREWLGARLSATPADASPAENAPPSGAIVSAGDLAEPLRACHASLVATGNALIAGGRLTDVIRRVAVFGVTLVRLDIRQESARHLAMVDAITRALGRGSYADWPEEQRVEFLIEALAAPHRLRAPFRRRSRSRAGEALRPSARWRRSRRSRSART
jgi:phosphoenolpyruvate carboxylase